MANRCFAADRSACFAGQVQGSSKNITITRAWHRAGCNLGVEGGAVQLGVPEQDLDDPDVGAILQQVGGEAVTQRMRPEYCNNPYRQEREERFPEVVLDAPPSPIMLTHRHSCWSALPHGTLLYAFDPTSRVHQVGTTPLCQA